MGYEMYRMIRDGAPPEWTPAMRLVAMTIADDARDPGQGTPKDGGRPWSAVPVCGYREKGKWRDGLTERTGMSEHTVRRVLADLGRADYEMREQVTTDKRGRPVFACKGHALRFRVPLLKPRQSPPDMADLTAQQSPPDTADLTRPKAARSGPKGGQIRSQRSPDPGGPIPSGPPHIPSVAAAQPPLRASARARDPAGIIRAAYPDATDDEIKIITEDRTSHGARNLAAVLAHEIREGTLRLPCDRDGPYGHSNACRDGDGAACGMDGCSCRCHQPAAETRPAPGAPFNGAGPMPSGMTATADSTDDENSADFDPAAALAGLGATETEINFIIGRLKANVGAGYAAQIRQFVVTGAGGELIGEARRLLGAGEAEDPAEGTP